MKTFLQYYWNFSVKKSAGLFLLALIVWTGNVWGQNPTTYTSNGIFTVPEGIRKVTVEAWGGGGGGGAAGAFLSTGRGGGGAGGSFTRDTISVSTGNYTITVGNGGAGGTGTNNGTAGGTSSFGTLVTAAGGAFGYSGVNGNGNGGSITTGTTYNGGAGSAGATSSGAGGGGAGNEGAGGNASGATGGAGGTGGDGTTTGGAGAAGRSNNGTGNSATNLSAGGGGGYYSGILGSNNGGAGYRGQVIVYWTCPSIVLYSATGTDNQTICPGSAITPIVYTIGDNYVTANVTGLPTGVLYNIVGNTLTISGTPTATGSYTITLTKPTGCSSDAVAGGSITIDATKTWTGTTDTHWNTATNWLCGSVPAPGEDIIFSTSAANDLILDQDRTIGNLTNNSGKALVIPTGRTLTIGGTATTNSADRIVLESAKGLANGALIFTNPASNTNVQATVEFASKSQPATGTWPRAWQYFGVPVSGKSLTDLFGTNVQGSIYGGDAAVNTIVRKYEESQTIPGNLQEKWANLNLTDELLPYYGYEITQPQTVFENADSSPYQFKGPLVTEATKTLNLTSTTGVYASGSFILANPYAAPIFYDNIVDGDFENLQKVFYIFNTGSRKQWEDANGESELGEQPGTYTSIPLFVTGEIEKFQIPSMQGFLVAADNLSLASSFKFRYETVYRPSTVTTPNEPMLIQRAENDKKPKNKPDKDAKPVITMDVIGENSSDRLYLIKADEATKAYDDGWDGFKFISPNVAQLYAFDQDGNRLQVNSDSDLNDTYIGFRSGGESSYKLRFRFTNLDGVYSTVFLEDLATGMTEIVTDGMILNFSPAAGSAEKRFRITVEAAKGKSTGLDNSKLIKIHVASKRIVVDNNTDENGMLTVYDVTGTPIFEKEFVPGRNDIMINLKKGSYIIEAKTASERTVVKSI